MNTRLSSHINEPYPLFLDATAVRRTNDRVEREKKTRDILKYLDESGIGSGYSRASEPSDLEIDIGFERRGYGVFGMTAGIVQPTAPNQDASRIATQAMRQMAHDLGTYPDVEIPNMVYANISREHGMTFETNPMASSSMDTDGFKYNPSSERISLHAHNLYTHEMQLICISGLIALTKGH